MSEPQQPSVFTPLDRVLRCFDKVLELSPADHTELVWVERQRGEVSTARRQPVPASRQHELQVRVREMDRIGVQRASTLEPPALLQAVRHALAQARSRPVVSYPEPAPEKSPELPDTLYDPELAKVQPATVRSLLGELVERGERARLSWVEGRVAVASSSGLRRRVRVTCATLQAASGRGPGAGLAVASARLLAAY